VTLLALGAALVTGILANLALRTFLISVATTLAFLALLVTLWMSGVIETIRARVFSASVVLVVVWLPIRASDWLVTLNTMTAIALIAATVLVGNAALPRALSSELVNFVDRIFGGFLAPRLLAGSIPVRGRSQVLASTIRGIALAALPVITLAVLLANADAVFASVLSPGWNMGAAVSHATLTAVITALVLGLICVYRLPAHRDTKEPMRPIGAIEALVIVGSTALLFAAFAIAQLVTALGGADHVLAAQSLTRAEYARRGFFQLLWVAALTLGLLGLISVGTKIDGALVRARRITNGVLSLLTVVIVAISIIRLRLYTEAFGQTMLRWYCTAFAAMLGIVFVLLAMHYLLGLAGPWFARALAAIPLATLLFVNIANPEARVAEHNLSRDTSVVALDGTYLIGLSADAWPTILKHEERVVESVQQGRVSRGAQARFDARCRQSQESPGFGIFGFNLARSQVDCE